MPPVGQIDQRRVGREWYQNDCNADDSDDSAGDRFKWPQPIRQPESKDWRAEPSERDAEEETDLLHHKIERRPRGIQAHLMRYDCGPEADHGPGNPQTGCMAQARSACER